MPKREVSYCHLYFPLLLKYYKLDEGVIRIFKNARAIDIVYKEVQSDFNESSRFVTKLQNRAENRRVTNFNNFANFSSRLHVSRYFWKQGFFFSVLAFRPDVNGVFGSQKRGFSKAFPKVDVCEYDDVMVCGTSPPNWMKSLPRNIYLNTCTCRKDKSLKKNSFTLNLQWNLRR